MRQQWSEVGGNWQFEVEDEAMKPSETSMKKHDRLNLRDPNLMGP